MKILAFLLYPFAVLYDAVTRIRNYFFNVGIFTSTSFKIPVVAVGNLSVGGTGKTPQIEYLIRLLKREYKLAVLSRGYKRATKGFILLNKTNTAKEVGDEPLQYFKKFKNIIVAVDEKRVHGIKQLIAQKSVDLVLLDDAYQHRKVAAGLYILLTKYSNLYVDDYLLPMGRLRESKQGAKRAQIILVTKCPLDLSEKVKREIVARLNPGINQKVFFTGISYAQNIIGNLDITISEVADFKVILITGIAEPKPLLAFLSEKNIEYTHLNFPDHHQFSNAEISDIKQEYDKITAPKKLILTTEKDYVRLIHKLPNLNYLPIETTFLFDQKAAFDAEMKQFSESKVN